MKDESDERLLKEKVKMKRFSASAVDEVNPHVGQSWPSQYFRLIV
jgi:hypothetical protein